MTKVANRTLSRKTQSPASARASAAEPRYLEADLPFTYVASTDIGAGEEVFFTAENTVGTGTFSGTITPIGFAMHAASDGEDVLIHTSFRRVFNNRVARGGTINVGEGVIQASNADGRSVQKTASGVTARGVALSTAAAAGDEIKVGFFF